MQRVDKKNYTIIFIMSFIVMYFMAGCASKNEYTNSIKYFDNNVTKDKLLHAAKKVFYFAGKDSFIIDSYRNDLNVTKSKATYKFYTMDIENDHFDFNVDNNSSEKELKATVSIYREYGIDKDSTNYIDKDSKVYTLFWDRLEYFLGSKKEWNECAFYDFEGFFCDPIDLENKDGKVEDIIDLTIDHNNTKQMKKMKILDKNSSIILKNQKKDKINNNTTTTPQSSSNTQEQYGVLFDNFKTFDSYKIQKYEKQDDNNSIKYKQRLDKNKYKKRDIKK